MCQTLYFPICTGPTAYTSAHMYTCQVRPFSSPSPEIAHSGLRVSVYVFVWFHLVYILHLHIRACLHAWFKYSKSRNLIITTGRVSYQAFKFACFPEVFCLNVLLV